MDQKQAVAKLKKVLGTKLAYRVNNKVPIGEERERTLALKTELAGHRKTLREKLEARKVEVLRADVEYMALKRLVEEATKEYEALYSEHCHRIEVGVQSSAGGFDFFSVRASGDTWAEVVEKICSTNRSIT